MSTYRLERLFAPRSVALVGASPRPTSVGRTILNNLRTAGFAGPIQPRQSALQRDRRRHAVKSIADLPDAPDVVVIAAPPAEVPGLIAAAGAKGIPAAIVITAGLGHGSGLAVRSRRTRGPRIGPARSSAPTASASSFRR